MCSKPSEFCCISLRAIILLLFFIHFCLSSQIYLWSFDYVPVLFSPSRNYHIHVPIKWKCIISSVQTNIYVHMRIGDTQNDFISVNEWMKAKRSNGSFLVSQFIRRHEFTVHTQKMPTLIDPENGWQKLGYRLHCLFPVTFCLCILYFLVLKCRRHRNIQKSPHPSYKNV